MSHEVIVDALPYIDQGYDDPGVREAALHMVEEETRRFRPTKNYLEHLPPLKLNVFETDIMRNEFERLQQNIPMEQLSMKRYELPKPPPGRMNDIVAWNECVENSYSQLQHQLIRLNNLELLSEYGCEIWRNEVQLMLKFVEDAQHKLHNLKKQIQEVNYSRKNHQTRIGEQLKELETKWVSLVSKNYEIEQACAQLQSQLYDLNLMKQRESR